VHFTYKDLSSPEADLEQGDIIKRSPEVDKILEQVHPHYLKKDYRFFLLLTQSCDLTRRNSSECKARYISIAAVRPVEEALKRELLRFQNSPSEKDLNLCSMDRKPKLLQFVERLINNNAEGYFFLNREPAMGLTDHCCALLHLSVALKARLHYPTLMDARILRLKDQFQHKLGYLVGHMYSRIATEDWMDHVKEPQFKQFQDEMIELTNVIWIEKQDYPQLIKRLKQEESPTLETVDRVAKELKTARLSRKAQILEQVEKAMKDVNVNEPAISGTVRRLSNSAEFNSLLK